MWLHYSDKRVYLSELKNKNQRDGRYPSPYNKPKGFWTTREGDDGWYDWCIENEYNLKRLTHAHQVVLDHSDILMIDNINDFDRFSKKYGSPITHEEIRKIIKENVIDWGAVSEKYKGIIISPYRYDRRLLGQHIHSAWYCGWDCASGCIWDMEAIKEINLIHQEEKVELR
jgi:hypothetical protein